MEDTASDFAARVMAPAAERVRDKADDLLDRLGNESRDVLDRVSTRIETLPAEALAKMSLVPMRQARRQKVMFAVGGLLLGLVIARALWGERNDQPQQGVGWEPKDSEVEPMGALRSM